MKQNNAFTGLEAAIVLIAFVVVASIFSYVMLNAGFFASQKAQDVTYASIKQVTSIMYVSGSVSGSTTNDGSLNSIEFGLRIPDIGQAQDLKDLRLLFSTYNALPVDIPNTKNPPSPTQSLNGEDCWIFRTDKDWTYIQDGKPTLVSGQNGGTVSSSVAHSKNNIHIRILLGHTIGPRSEEDFTLEILPRLGPPTLISKTLPTGYRGGRIR